MQLHVVHVYVTPLMAVGDGMSAIIIVSILKVCPGWVRTQMGGQTAHRSTEQGTTIVPLSLYFAIKPSLQELIRQCI